MMQLMICCVLAAKQMTMQIDDRLSDLRFGFGVITRHDAWFDIGKEPALARFFGEVESNVFTSNVVGHDALNCSHCSTWIGHPFGDSFRINSTIQDL